LGGTGTCCPGQKSQKKEKTRLEEGEAWQGPKTTEGERWSRSEKERKRRSNGHQMLPTAKNGPEKVKRSPFQKWTTSKMSVNRGENQRGADATRGECSKERGRKLSFHSERENDTARRDGATANIVHG